ncbi:MAG: flagellar filament capping protein FliD [Anaerotignaceae bacterium]
MRIYGNINSYTGRSGTTTRMQSLMRRRKNSGISAATNSATSSVDLSSLLDKSSSTNSSSSDSSTVVSATYEKIGTTASSVTTHANKLLATGKSGLFDEDEESSEKAVKEIKSFVENYNSLMTQMQKSGSKTYKAFAKELKAEATSSKASLEAAGITCKSDGTLSIDSDKLTDTDLSDLKKIFQGSTSFCAKASEKCTTVNKRAALDKAISSYTGSTSKTSYSTSV